jgi:hypothetical protein
LNIPTIIINPLIACDSWIYTAHFIFLK